ncbi:MAG: hypothetical protein IT312_13800 [Anaerolineales bacterium]|nr:hypothetical protein [Anaerolineales bacterium]
MKKVLSHVSWIALFVLSACSPQRQGNPPSAADAYTVNLTPADFAAVVDNPYYPLIPGTIWVYEARLKNGSIERIELEVLHETRIVNGVAVTVLHDTVFVNGVIVEETYDWFAQDKDGNVWYLGEEVDNYVNGALTNHAGAWEWGKDGALPGIYMWADPSAHMNETYYQEFYAGEAEDQGQVQSIAEAIAVPIGTFDNVVRTLDTSPLDSKLQENKYYAAGIGVIKEVDLLTGEEVILIEFTSGN